jgi:pentatricopeptide repeat protein
MKFKKPPYAFRFIPKTLTQAFVWSCIRVNGAFKQNNTDLALELIEEMMEKAQQYQQIGPAPSFVNFRAVC